MAYVYIVECEDGTLYTGITKDIKKRMKTHLEGGPSGAKYTKSHKVRSVAALWTVEDYNAAAKLEYAIKKRLTRAQKLELIANPETLCDVFPDLSEFGFEYQHGADLEKIILD